MGGAYGSFLAEKRSEYMEACQGQQASAVSKMAGEAWQKLSDAEKAPYQQKYEAAKAKYDDDMKTFLEAGGEKSKGTMALRSEKRAAKNAKKAKDPNQPKKPVGGGYGVFLNKNREEITKSLPEGHKITDVTKAAGEKWKVLSEEARKPFEAEFAQKMEEYNKAMGEYSLAHPEESSEDGSSPKMLNKRSLASVGTSPATKCRRVGETAPEAVAIDAEVLKAARRKGLDGPLRNLISRQEVAGSGKSHKQMLEALQSSGGLVNKAKSILLSHLGA